MVRTSPFPLQPLRWAPWTHHLVSDGVAGGAAVRPGELFEEPIVIIFGPVLYALIANLCCTRDWIVDVPAYRGSPRKGLFKLRFILSLVLTALPGMWAVVAVLIILYTGPKLD